VLPRIAHFERSVPVEFTGATRYGGWFVPSGCVQRDWVVYSAGVGADVTFDTALIERYGCEVYAFDPTDGARAHLEQVAEPRIHFKQVAVWSEDGEIEMYKAATPSHFSVSAVNLQNTSETVTAPAHTIDSLMVELGHDHVDLLKLLIDGAEYEVLGAHKLRKWGVQVLITGLFHHDRSPFAANEFIRSIEAEGYALVASKVAGYTFLRRE
jgi:FkbM family methyltransferase